MYSPQKLRWGEGCSLSETLRDENYLIIRGRDINGGTVFQIMGFKTLCGLCSI